jgi:hypothetical protein
MADQFSSDDGLGPSQPGGTGTDTSKPTHADSVVRPASAGRPDGSGALPPEPLSREGLDHLDGLRGELAEPFTAERHRARSPAHSRSLA